MRLRLQLLVAFISFSFFLGVSFAQGARPDALGSDAAIYQKIDSLNEAAFEAKRKNTDVALTLLAKAARLADDYDYKKGRATNLLYEAGIYQQNSYSEKALGLYYRALELSKQVADTLNVARANQQIGNALLEAENLTEAEVLYKQAKQSYTALGRQDDLVNITNSLGLVKLKQHDLKVAEKYFTEALTTSKQANYGYGLKKAHYHLGLVYLQKEEYAAAKEHFAQALVLDEHKGDNYGLSLTKNKLSEVALREKAYKTAIQLATEALQHAQAVPASELEEAAMDNLIAVYKATSNYPELIKWQDMLIERQKQAFKEEKSEALGFLDILKEKQEEQLVYEKQAFEAQQQAELTNVILAVACLGLVMLSLLALMWYKNYKKVKDYSIVLATKNKEIAKASVQLERLNETITNQNKSLEENGLMKDKLFSIVSHDLRSPFASLRSILNLAQRRPMSHEEVKKYLLLLNKQVDAVMNMLDNLLAWSKNQLKGGGVFLEPLWLHQLIEENMQFVATQAEHKNIILKNAVPVDAFALGDRERLSFVVRNLLMNAIKFTYEGGQVVINTRDAQDKIVLMVADNGKGIAPDNLKKLFKDNEQFTTTGTAKEKGTGLGLKLSKDFMHSIGGSIAAESKEQEGSIFYVTLPKPPLALAQNTVSKEHMV
ncbi:tetratricopeptide repeat-containing sensor histidine kinase [Pontibacter sp. SGAir0037]|uniref:ATP-binding protein n=1 Tax=Pontibacter sp. SGAir0037 TaxID=2571030 RepID=UPI0010CD12C0|nr:tetratricopeptide repeat-containing sensor histidine kinase [Pontibacter sp. SGAir0037]QCR23904.1 hypothetical protein C1N53_17140 [Pontibacter sp. SGAir0037]